MDTCVIIPARYQSSRFPGKPLVNILGKPMVIRVAERAAAAVGRQHVYIATDDGRIASVVNGAGFDVLMTNSESQTGTDRVAEAAGMIDYRIYLNVQGDEPMVNPRDIARCAEIKRDNWNCVVNGFAWLSDDEDPRNVDIPKVVTTERLSMIYMSRLPIPGCKSFADAPARYMKQVCIYGFSRTDLEMFRGFGRKGYAERVEDIEVLRFLEIGRSVLMYETGGGTIAVDVPADIGRVENALRAQCQ